MKCVIVEALTRRTVLRRLGQSSVRETRASGFYLRHDDYHTSVVLERCLVAGVLLNTPLCTTGTSAVGLYKQANLSTLPSLIQRTSPSLVAMATVSGWVECTDKINDPGVISFSFLSGSMASAVEARLALRLFRACRLSALKNGV